MDKRNSEGYQDPTAYKALAEIMREERESRYMPLVYIASPLAGDTEGNIVKAQDYCRFAIGQGCIPLAPHLHYPQFMDDEDIEQRALGIRFALILLGKCDEVWAFGETVSAGMSREIAKAMRRGMPLRYFNSNCEEVFKECKE